MGPLSLCHLLSSLLSLHVLLKKILPFPSSEHHIYTERSPSLYSAPNILLISKALYPGSHVTSLWNLELNTAVHTCTCHVSYCSRDSIIQARMQAELQDSLLSSLLPISYQVLLILLPRYLPRRSISQISSTEIMCWKYSSVRPCGAQWCPFHTTAKRMLTVRIW